MATTSVATKKTADNIRRIRLQRELTQLQLATKIGKNDNYYAKVERGELAPALEVYEKIAKALKVTSADIFPF